MGRFEKSERLFFYPEGRTYSPLPKLAEFWSAVVFQHSLKPCALRGLRLRWSHAETAAEPPTSVRLPVRQPHCQRCTTALTAWVSLRRHPVLLNRFRNTFLTRRCRDLIFPSQFFKGGLDAMSRCKRNKNLIERIDFLLWQSII